MGNTDIPLRRAVLCRRRLRRNGATMFTETRKSGIKQFLSGLMFMLCAYTAAIILRGLLPNRILLRTVITIVMYCAAVYVIYIRYAAVYTYILGKKSLTAFVRAGRRTDEITVNYNKISSVSYGKRFHAPLSHKTFTTSLLPNKNYCCIIYNKDKNALIIEVSEDFYNKLKERVK